jgi:epoxyqueuosine reductase
MGRSTSTCETETPPVVQPAPAELTRRIKEKALALGFARAGVTAAEPLEEPAERLARWLALGRHATMRWMERGTEARRDPAVLLPGARSILSVAANYFSDAAGAEGTAPEAGRVSRYAAGRDYHAVLRERLRALLDAIVAMAPGCRGRIATDAAPLLEKAIAERAGIGWIGKHTNLITRTHGSWVFLGEILLTVELESDAPFPADFCGSCVRCIEACPTGAIVAPRELDSARCISYATIEHRGEIPEAFRGRMDGWLFGCDVCQEVCPWNRFSRETPIDDFLPNDALAGLTLDDVARMSDDDFSERLAGIAISRARSEGLRRNARFLLEEKR